MDLVQIPEMGTKMAETWILASPGRWGNMALKMGTWPAIPFSLRLLNALNSEDRGLKVRFSLATIAFDRESASQILLSQGKNAPSNPYPHYLVRLATSRFSNHFQSIFSIFRAIFPPIFRLDQMETVPGPHAKT